MSSMGALATAGQQTIANNGLTNPGSSFSQSLQAYPIIGGSSFPGSAGAFNPSAVVGNTPNQGSQNQWTSGAGQQSAQTTTQDLTANQNTNTVNDALGLGPLIQSNATAANGVDVARNANLTPLANGTAPSYAANIGQQVDTALSGPQATGSGNMANIRSAGTAASNANAQNVQNQIAANSAMGTQATNAAVSNATPYLGSTSTGLNNALSTGLANAFDENYAVGEGPTSTTTQSSGGGGSFICAALLKDHLISPEMMYAGTVHKLKRGPRMYRGYKKFAKVWLLTMYQNALGKWMSKEWNKYLCWRYLHTKSFSLIGWVEDVIFSSVCYVMGE